MKITNVTRTAALLFSLFLLLSAVSCHRSMDNDTETERTLVLTVETPPANYSAEQIRAKSERMASLAAALVRKTEGLVLNETQLQKLSASISQSVFPVLAEIPVYPEELDALLSAAESLLDAHTEGQANNRLLWFRFYQSHLTYLGSTRTGMLCYRFINISLLQRAEDCDARYEQYGYAWYHEDALRYRALASRLETELGEAALCGAVETIAFAASLMLGAQQNGQDSLLSLTPDELVLLLQKQSAHFAEQELTEAQWGLLGELLAECSVRGVDAALQGELTALQTNGYFGKAAKAMPALLGLYRAITERMTPADAQKIFFSENSAERTEGICHVLRSCETEFFVFTQAFETYAASKSAAEETALKRGKRWEDCQAFLAEHPAINAEELFHAVSTCTADTADTAEQAWKAYFAAHLPYLTYLLQRM